MIDRTRAGMCCPKCKSMELAVMDSRGTTFDGQSTIRRRRMCRKCKHRFSTQEVLIDIDFPSRRYTLDRMTRKFEEASAALMQALDAHRAVLKDLSSDEPAT